jgi:hypothetical protein
MDKHWERLRVETPHVKRPPSEYVREHVWFTTQPIEEPDNPQHLAEVIDWLGWDRLMFSTDYPHWDFDDPQHTFKFAMTEAQKAKVFGTTPRRCTACREASGRCPRRRSRAGPLQDRQCERPRDRRVQSERRIFRPGQPLPARRRTAVSGQDHPLVQSDGPGHYRLARHQEFLRCPGTAGSSRFAPASPGAIRSRPAPGSSRSKWNPARRW